MKTLIILALLPVIILSQSWVAAKPPWLTIIAPSRAIDWRLAGVRGGIPAVKSQCGSTVAPVGTPSTPASPSTIQTAINACTSGQYVLLGCGDFYLSSGFRIKGQPGVSIFGCGPSATGSNATRIHFSAGDTDCNFPFQPGLCVENTSEAGYLAPDHTANWTAGFSQGTNSITLDSDTGLTVGSILFLDQIDTSNTDNGTLWVNAVQGIASTEGIAGVQRGTYPTTRGQGQTVVVTSVPAGNCGTTCVIGISPSIYMPNWCPEGGLCPTTKPGAWWPNDTTSKNGVENILLDSTNNATAGGGNLGIMNCVDCWVRNVTLQTAGRASLWIFQSARVTVQSFYMFGAQSGGSQSYGIETDIAADGLIENGIFQQVTAAMITGEQASGMVYGYNFQIHDTYANPVTWMDAAAYHHSLANVYTLWEGNYASGMTTDSIHGGSFFQASFRNYYRGLDTGKNRETDAIQVTSTNRYFNYLGNVLGSPSFHTTYECAATSASQAACPAGIDLSIYILNWSDHALIFDNITTPGVTMNADASGKYILTGNQAWDGAGSGNPTVNYAFTPGAVVTFSGFPSSGNNVKQTLDSFNSGAPCATGIDCIAVVHSNAGMVTESSSSATSAKWEEVVNNDTLVKSTMLRYGNWDTVNAATQFNTSEVPSGLSVYPNQVPPTRFLPKSLYLTKKPYWWTVVGQPNIPWPPIGPDVYYGNVTGLGGHVWQIPAMVCYLNIMGGPADGSGSILSFDARKCYAPPQPPPPSQASTQERYGRIATGTIIQAPPITFNGSATTSNSGAMSR